MAAEEGEQLEAPKSSRAQLLIAAGVVLAVCYVGKLVMITLLVSMLLAFMLAPVAELFEKVRLPRALASALAVLLLLGLLYALMYFSYSRGLQFAQELPQYSGKIRQMVLHVRRQAQQLQKTTETVIPPSPEDNKIIKFQPQTNWPELLTRGAGTVTDILLAISFVPFLVYFMLTWQDHTRAATVMLFRLENRNAAYATLGRVSAMLRSFIVGNMLIGLFMSLAGMVVFGMLKIPYFYFIGFISGFLSLIPYLGVVLASIPPVVAGIGQLHGPVLAGVVLTVLGLHIFSINVLYPKIIGRRLQLNPLVVTIGLLVWGWIWGAMGLILAVPILGAMKIVFDHVDSLRALGTWMGE